MDIWTVQGRAKSFVQLGWPPLKNTKKYPLVDSETVKVVK